MKALGSVMLEIGEMFFVKMKDIKVFDNGLISKQGFKDHLIKCDVIQRRGEGKQDSSYSLNLK